MVMGSRAQPSLGQTGDTSWSYQGHPALDVQLSELTNAPSASEGPATCDWKSLPRPAGGHYDSGRTGCRDPMFVFRTTALRSPARARADPETRTSHPNGLPQPRKPQLLMSIRWNVSRCHRSRLSLQKVFCKELIWSRNILVRVGASKSDLEKSGRMTG